jgi:hypothetical protein
MSKDKEPTALEVKLNENKAQLATLFGAPVDKLPMIDLSSFVAFTPGGIAQLRIKRMNLRGKKMELYDMPTIKSPSGETPFFTVGDQPAKTIKGIVVEMAPGRNYYKSDKNTEKGPPQCQSTDMVYGIGDPTGISPDDPVHPQFPSKDQRYECALCPWDKFKTGHKDGAGKRCKEHETLFFIRQEDAMAWIVTVPPSGLAGWREFKENLTVPFMLTLVEIGLVNDTSKGGQAYSKMVFKPQGLLPLETIDKIGEYVSVLSGIVEGLADDPYSEVKQVIAPMLAAPTA